MLTYLNSHHQISRCHCQVEARSADKDGLPKSKQRNRERQKTPKKTIKFGYKPGQEGPRETNSTKSKKTQTWKLKIFILLLHQNQNKKKQGKCKTTDKTIKFGYKPGEFREAPTLCATINQYLITKNNDNIWLIMILKKSNDIIKCLTYSNNIYIYCIYIYEMRSE